MTKLIAIATLLFTVLLSAPSYAKWTKVIVAINGDTHYVDFERIRKHGGYVYFWSLNDHLKPTKYGDFSAKMYQQGDCKLFRFKDLSISSHKEPMGVGTEKPYNPKNPEWEYPAPNSMIEIILKAVCSR